MSRSEHVEVNGDGSLTWAEASRMTRDPFLFLELDCRRATADDDPWYDVPGGPAVLPVVDDSGWGRRNKR
jgi:hypothetical protein